MTRSGAESAVVSSALIVGGMYAYRKLAEPGLTAGGAHQSAKGSAAAKALGGGSPPVAVHKFAVGFCFTYLVLALVAAGLPDLAGALAMLIALSAVLVQGGAVFTDIAEATA